MLDTHEPAHSRNSRPSAEAVKVRTGTPADVHRMMDIAMMATEENGLVSPNPKKLVEHIWAALNLDHGIIGIIGEPGKQIEAAVLLRVGTMWYSDQEALDEKCIFVHPDFRSAKGGRAAKLCKFSMEAADALGIPLTIGILSSIRSEAKVRMYRRILGEPSGAYWTYRPNTVVGQ